MGDLYRMYAEARQFNANGMDAEKVKSNEIFKVYLNAPASHVAVNFGFGVRDVLYGYCTSILL